MIRVNLLPEGQKQKTAKGPKIKRDIPYTWIFIGLVVVMITSAVLGFVHLSIQKKADAIQSEILRYQNEIKKLKVDVQKVERVKAQRNELNNKLAIIDKLKNAQKGPVHLLDQLASCIPPRVWLNSMSEQSSSMSLDGKALEHQSISRFMQKLEESPFFRNVELTTATAEMTKGKSEGIKAFHINCVIEIPQEYL